MTPERAKEIVRAGNQWPLFGSYERVMTPEASTLSQGSRLAPEPLRFWDRPGLRAWGGDKNANPRPNPRRIEP